MSVSGALDSHWWLLQFISVPAHFRSAAVVSPTVASHCRVSVSWSIPVWAWLQWSFEWYKYIYINKYYKASFLAYWCNILTTHWYAISLPHLHSYFTVTSSPNLYVFGLCSDGGNMQTAHRRAQTNPGIRTVNLPDTRQQCLPLQHLMCRSYLCLLHQRCHLCVWSAGIYVGYKAADSLLTHLCNYHCRLTTRAVT